MARPYVVLASLVLNGHHQHLLVGMAMQDYNLSAIILLSILCLIEYSCSSCILLQVDLVEIKAAFLQRYHKTLYKMIEGDTSGDYRKLLQAIVGRN